MNIDLPMLRMHSETGLLMFVFEEWPANGPHPHCYSSWATGHRSPSTQGRVRAARYWKYANASETFVPKIGIPQKPQNGNLNGNDGNHM